MLTFFKILHFYFLFLQLLILILHVICVRIRIAGIDGFGWTMLWFLGWAMLALPVLTWLSSFHFSRFLPGRHYRTEANLSTAKSVSLFLLFLSYQLFLFNFFFDSSFLHEVLLLVFLFFKCFFSLFLLNLQLQFFSIWHFLGILLLSFLIGNLLVEICNFGFLSWIWRSFLLFLLLLWWTSYHLIFISPLKFLNLSLALIHRRHFHLHTLFRRWRRLSWRSSINRSILFHLFIFTTEWVVI